MTPDRERWEKAADAARAAFNAAIEAGNHLYNVYDNPIENYKNIILNI